MTEQVARRLTVIVSADVVEYSRLIRADEAGTRASLNDHQRALLEPALDAYQCRLVSTAGDSFLVEFASVVDAVEWAVGFQRGVAERNVETPKERQLVFRIGINAGDVIVEDDDIHGDGVNLAARLQSLAEPGGICVAANIFEQVRNRLPYGFDDLGEQSVKNIPDPVRVYAIKTLADAAAGQATETKTLSLPNKPAIAVLPFTNMSGDPEQEYFSDGIADDILTGLSRFRELFVIARNSSFTYKGSAVDVKQVGRELGVRYVLEGGVRKAANRVRINAQLIDATTGNHIWAEKFDGDVADIFDFQDQITEQIVGAIHPGIFVAEIGRARRKHVDSLDAYDMLMHGWHEALSGAPDGLAAGQDYAEQALAADPDYGAAYTLLSWILCFGALFEAGESAEASRSAAALAARRAVERDESDAQAHAVLALALTFQREHDTALAEARRAVEANPNLAFAAFAQGAACTFAGDAEKGVAECRRALRLSPRDPFSFVMLTMLSLAQYTARDYAGAVDAADQIVALRPDYFYGHWQIATGCAQLGQTNRAARAAREMRRLLPSIDRAFVESVAPYRDLGDLEHDIEGLRKAGLEI